MKRAAIAILFVLVALSGANASRVSAIDAATATSTKDPSWWVWIPWWRMLHPIPPRWCWPFHPFPPSPSPTSSLSKVEVNSDTQRCLGDGAHAKSCFNQISESYNTQSISLSQECSNAIKSMDFICSSTVFSKFNNPLFEYAIKQYSANPQV
ncbi:uncharacterized protein LOC123220869 [Mangifera indica]|uniref:uncharacterized protein LOC123220869 n=1 Tax=Mangifera indica TaxID=29780 RepID=UPI001CF9400C|nr:uncharacterized protein LOC123220869 [Mangifera indica]